MLKNAGGANPTGHAASGGCFGDRKMFLTYVGESGITGTTTTDSSQPHQVYTGLFIHESQSISVNGEFDALFAMGISNMAAAMGVEFSVHRDRLALVHEKPSVDLVRLDRVGC